MEFKIHELIYIGAVLLAIVLLGLYILSKGCPECYY